MKNTIFLIFSLFLISICNAETVYLKNGKSVSGRILEKTDKYIKIDFQGVPLTYWLDEVSSISAPSLEIDPVEVKWLIK
jgi:hypothetical protein